MADEPTMRIPLRTCERCGKPIVADMKECFSCGASIAEEKKLDEQLLRCSTCGKELARGATMCSMCGTRLRPERSVTPSSAPVSTSSSSRQPPISLTTLEHPDASLPSLTRNSLFELPKRMGLGLGTLAFLLLGFVGGKLLFRDLAKNASRVERSVVPEAAAPAAPAPSVTAPVAQPTPLAPVSETPTVRIVPKGHVVTADGLMKIQVFGPGAKAPTRTATTLRERVEEFLPSLRSIYSEKLLTNQQLLGAVVVEFALSPEGKVSQVNSHTTGMENPEFLQMVRSLVQEWQFEPASTGAVTVFYPLLFTPKELDPFSLIGWSKDLLPGRYRMLGGDPAPVRLGPDDGETEVGRVSPGLRVDVVGSQKGWLAVLSPKGKVGYVHREALFPRIEGEPPIS